MVVRRQHSSCIMLVRILNLGVQVFARNKELTTGILLSNVDMLLEG
jgi:hypothetical protein